MMNTRILSFILVNSPDHEGQCRQDHTKDSKHTCEDQACVQRVATPRRFTVVEYLESVDFQIRHRCPAEPTADPNLLSSVTPGSQQTEEEAPQRERLVVIEKQD